MFTLRLWPLLLGLILPSPFAIAQTFSPDPDKSVARNWSEVLLQALQVDNGQVAVNARNVFHFSVALYDAWAVYDTTAKAYLAGKSVGGFSCPLSGADTLVDSTANRELAINFAAYRFLRHRFSETTADIRTRELSDILAAHYGMDTAFTSTDYRVDGAAALGNYIAQCVIDFGLQDGANQVNRYAIQHYLPANPPLDPLDPLSIEDIVDPDRWQKLALESFRTKTGNLVPAPDFETPEWGRVQPFSLRTENRTVFNRADGEYWVYHDPGKPALLNPDDPQAQPAEYLWGHSLVAVWGGHLDPTRGHGATLIDISPASLGNVGALPQTIPGLRDFYSLDGRDGSLGHSLNPHTGEPYAEQRVPRADYARVLLSYWADGPFTALTPAGFMMYVLNRAVSDNPNFDKRWMGQGATLDALEWDVKAYFALAGATHDAAVTTWSIKGWYDYVRPVSAIRYMALMGQSSDPDDPDCPYHTQGLPYVADNSDPAGDGSLRVIDCVRAGDALAGEDNINVGKMKVFSWRGPLAITDADNEVAGVDWILAENWLPMMRAEFVTPPFAGYVSGHSTLTRAGAEALRLITGDAYFPSGLYSHTAEQNNFVPYEQGPSVTVTLQWATYEDMASAAGISRVWGGVHPPVDDIVGRRLGAIVGPQAVQKANTYFSAAEKRGGGGIDGMAVILLLLITAGRWFHRRTSGKNK